MDNITATILVVAKMDEAEINISMMLPSKRSESYNQVEQKANNILSKMNLKEYEIVGLNLMGGKIEEEKELI